MKKLLLPIAILTAITSLTACHLEDHTDPSKQGNAQTANHNGVNHNNNAETNNSATANIAGDAQANATNSSEATTTATPFDWAAIPTSTMAGLTSLQLPEDMKVIDKAVDDPEQYSGFVQDTILNLYNGETSYKESGNLTYFDIGMIEESQGFNQSRFDADIAAYMKSIGAVEFFNGVVPAEVVKQLKASDGQTNYDYMTGDVESTGLRQYALNHENGSQLIYQVTSDEDHGQIGLLEVSAASEPVNTTENTEASTQQAQETVETVEGAVEEVQTPTASEMKTQIEDAGKAVLNINFDTGKATIRQDNQPIVEQILALLTNNPELNLSIEGHTDNVGKTELNKQLSQRRAEQVKNLLVERGIDPQRLKSAGYGDSKPLVANDTEENRAANRRVELVKF